jgi:hypothetical protein
MVCVQESYHRGKAFAIRFLETAYMPQYNIKIDIEEIRCKKFDRINLHQERDQ